MSSWDVTLMSLFESDSIPSEPIDAEFREAPPSSENFWSMTFPFTASGATLLNSLRIQKKLTQ